MTRFFKYCGIFLLVIAGLLTLAVAAINLIPGDKYKDLISSGVKSATGRDLKIEGELDIKLTSTLAFKASGITFANADWGTRPHMVSIGAIEAEVALLPLLQGILDVTLLVNTPDLHLETHSSGQGNWEFQELVQNAVKTVEQVEESVEEAQREGGFPLRLLIRKVAITGTRIVYIDGKSGDRIRVNKEKLIIEHVDDKLVIELAATFNDIPLALAGSFDNSGFLKDNQTVQVNLDGHFGDIKLAAQGTAGPLIPGVNLDVDVNLKTESVAAFSPLVGQELPDIGPLAVSGKLIGKDGKFAVKDLVTSLKDKGIMAEIKGSIADLAGLDGVQLEANVTTEQLTKTCGLFGVQLESPLPDSFKAAIVAEGNLETLAVKQFQTEIKGQGLSVNANGQVKNIMTMEGVSANLLLDAESLDYIAEIAKTELPPVGSLKAAVNISSADKHFGRLKIKADVNVDTIQAKVAASVADVKKLTGIDADISFSVDSLASLNELVRQKLPDSGQVTLEGEINVKGGLKAPISIDTVLKSDGVMVALTGSIAEPLAARGIDLALNVEAESMQQVGKLTGIDFPSPDPMNLETKFIADNDSYELADLRLQIGAIDVKGKAAFQQPTESNDRPLVSAALHIGELDWRKRQQVRQDAAEVEAPPETEVEEVKTDDELKKKKVFSSDPLPWDPLRKLDADIEVTVETLKTLQLDLEKVIVGITLENGLLTLKPLQAKVGSGVFGGAATLDALNSPATFVADIKLSDASFRDFGGTVNFLVDLKGSGDSVAEIMARLDGQFQLDVRNATLKQSFMTSFGSSMLSSLNPFTKDKENTELTCAIVVFDIKDGIADANKTIAAQMTDVTWLGSGEINLITEEIAFGMNPKARKGLVGLGGLANLAYLGGTLAEPKVAFDPTDVAVKYGKYAAAVATGGLTFVADMLVSKVRANTDVCASILKKLDKIQAADEKSKVKAKVTTELKDEVEPKVKTDKKTMKKAEKKKSKARNLLDGNDSYL